MMSYILAIVGLGLIGAIVMLCIVLKSMNRIHEEGIEYEQTIWAHEEEAAPTEDS